ncbi:MAG: molybdenum ABC transporter ATP-binding protein [Burkholderiales bacterium]
MPSDRQKKMAAMTTVDIIRARFRLDYPDFLLDVDFEVPGRGVTALYGASGSGKTTLLRAIAGLVRIPGGYLEVNGQVWQDDKRGIFLPVHRRPLGYVFQEASLFAHLTIRRNLEYGLSRVPALLRRISLERAIELLGIGHLLDRMPAALSGGELQRAGIARALAVSPGILLMDEPLAALDAKRKKEVLPYLERLHGEMEIPVLYVSHAIEEISRLADHLVLLEQGRVLASGSFTGMLARLDLPIRLNEDAGVVLTATVIDHDRQWHLSRLDFAGGNLWVRDSGAALRQTLRIRILARDVSIALSPTADSSILNVLPVVVTGLGDDAHPALVLAQLDAGGVFLLARLSRRSAAALDLRPGLQVWAQIKAIALIE